MFGQSHFRWLALLAAIALAAVIIQATPLAFLPSEAADFAAGLAFGICLVLGVSWLGERCSAARNRR